MSKKITPSSKGFDDPKSPKPNKKRFDDGFKPEKSGKSQINKKGTFRRIKV